MYVCFSSFIPPVLSEHYNKEDKEDKDCVFRQSGLEQQTRDFFV